MVCAALRGRAVADDLVNYDYGVGFGAQLVAMKSRVAIMSSRAFCQGTCPRFALVRMHTRAQLCLCAHARVCANALDHGFGNVNYILPC